MSAVTYLQLDQSAADLFDRYEDCRRRKADLDARSRQLDRDVKEARDALLELLADCPLGRLPDGRVIAVEEHVQERRAQKACTITWKTIVLVQSTELNE